MGKNFHMIMKNDIYVSILLFLRLTIDARMRKLFKKNDFVWNVYQVLFLNYFLKWVHGFFFIYSVFEGYQLSFFFYMYTWLQWNPNFNVQRTSLTSSARKYFFCYFSKVILISWNQFSFGPKSLFAVGIGR